MTDTKKVVNITRNPAARAALTLLGALKAAERAGAKAERDRKAEDGPEALLTSLLGDEAEALVVNGQEVARLSSQRETGWMLNSDALSDPKVVAALQEQGVIFKKQYRFLQVL